MIPPELNRRLRPGQAARRENLPPSGRLTKRSSPEAGYLPRPPMSRAAAYRYRLIHDGISLARLNSYDAWSGFLGFERRYPFLDRRLVDFMLKLPFNQLARGGVSRFLVRQSLVGLLPEQIRQRTSKAHFTHLVEKGLAHEEKAFIQELIKDSTLARAGLVDQTALVRGWQDYFDHPAGNGLHLLMPLAAELWHRRREQSVMDV